MSKENNVYNYRKDNRSDSDFEYKIAKLTLEEEKYFRLFIETHNSRRKKRELTFEHCGNNANGKVVKELEELKGLCRPDYILNRCNDNDYLIKIKQPIEVQTCRILQPKECFIKKSKIDWPYDNITKKICTEDAAILFITGTGFKGIEQYSLLSPSFLKKIKNNGISYPVFLGGKPAYSFKYGNVKWKDFYGDSAQENLDLFGDKN